MFIGRNVPVCFCCLGHICIPKSLTRRRDPIPRHAQALAASFPMPWSLGSPRVDTAHRSWNRFPPSFSRSCERQASQTRRIRDSGGLSAHVCTSGFMVLLEKDMSPRLFPPHVSPDHTVVGAAVAMTCRWWFAAQRMFSTAWHPRFHGIHGIFLQW